MSLARKLSFSAAFLRPRRQAVPVNPDLGSGMRARLLVVVASLTLALVACTDHRPAAANSTTAPTLTGDPAHPGVTQGWVDTKLYFGLGLADHPDNGISEARWRDFLDHEVTPRFPDGLRVID